MTPLWFFPQGTGSDADLAKWGLDDLLRGVRKSKSASREMPGPEGTGTLMTVVPIDDDERVLSYQPDAQRWERHPDHGFWFGYDTKSPPTPEDMARKYVTPGFRGSESLSRPLPVYCEISSDPVTLADGHEWLIPIVKPDWWLPKKLKLIAGGEFEERVSERFEWLASEADRVAEAIRSQAAPRQSLVQFMAACLGVNYRVDPFILSCLGALDDQSIQRACMAALGVERVARMKLPEGTGG